MLSLQSIKVEVAKEIGDYYYLSLIESNHTSETTKIIDTVAKRYAEEALRMVAARAHILYEYMPVSDVHIPTREVDKNSILNLIIELQ